MVEHQPSKLDTWVRFPSPAFLLHKNPDSYLLDFYVIEHSTECAGKNPLSFSEFMIETGWDEQLNENHQRRKL